MNEKKPRRLGTIFLIVLACAGAVACAKSSTDQTPQVPTAFAVHRYGIDGAPDLTFNGTGVVVTDLDPAQFDFAVAGALQTDGSIIAAGQTVVNGQGVVAMVRYSAIGALDTAGFGTLGIVRTPVGSVNAEATAVAVQPDGKILVAAITFTGSSFSPTTGFALLRYNADGTLDNTTFNSAGTPPGMVTGPIGTGTTQDIVSLALQGDGKIVVAGATSSGSFVLARFTTTGTPDATFGGGTVTTPVGNGAMPPGIALQADGKIVAAGAVGNFNTTNAPDVALVRYNTDGSLDNGFGTGGIVTTDINSRVNYANAVAVQADGKIVVAGHANVSANASDIAVLRYNTNGTPDTTFGPGLQGFVVTDLGAFDNALSVALQPSGRIIVSGNTQGLTAAFAAVLGYDTAGNPDPTFGTGGMVIAGPTGPSNVASGNAVLVQPLDGKIVVVGYD